MPLSRGTKVDPRDAIREKNAENNYGAPADAGVGDNVEDNAPGLADMTVPELRKMAKERDIKIPRGSKHDDIIALLE